MPNIYVQPIVNQKCPRCGASSAQRSKQFKPLTAPASFGYYRNNRFYNLFHACVHCFDSIQACGLYINGQSTIQPRSGFTMPSWLLVKHYVSE